MTTTTPPADTRPASDADAMLNIAQHVDCGGQGCTNRELARLLRAGAAAIEGRDDWKQRAEVAAAEIRGLARGANEDSMYWLDDRLTAIAATLAPAAPKGGQDA